MVVVEVRQGTLGVDGRAWGPTENTVDRGSQLDEEDEEDEEDDEEEDEEDDEEEDDEEEEERRRRWGGEEGQATDIKSNNPHLAGGEKKESLRRKKIQVREKVGKSRNTVFFQWFVAPEGRKVGSL